MSKKQSEHMKKVWEKRKLDSGFVGFNKGKKFPPHSEEHKRKIAQSLKLSVNKGKFKKGSQSLEKHNQWKGGISKIKGYGNFYKYRHRDRKRGAMGTHTKEQWEELKKKFNYMCLCCKEVEPIIKLTEDHIIPIALGGTDYIENIQPLCNRCNSRKYTRIVDYRNIFSCENLA